MMKFEISKAKDHKRIKHIWEKEVLKEDLYFKDIEQALQENADFSHIHLLAEELKIESGVSWHPRQKAQKNIRKLADEILVRVPKIKKYSSFDNVYRAIREELKSDLNLLAKRQPTRDFENVIKNIFIRVEREIDNYTFFFPIDGIKLNGADLEELDFESVKVVPLTDKIKESLTIFGEEVRSYFEGICIQCTCQGDKILAKDLAKERAKEIVNYLRLVIFFYLLDHLKNQKITYRRIIKINFLANLYKNDDYLLFMDSKREHPALMQEFKRENEKAFPLTDDRIRELKNHLYLDLSIRIIKTTPSERSHLENTVIRALTWFGEAINQFNQDEAFLRCWIAIDCLLSENNRKVKEKLAKRISILLHLGPYPIDNWNFIPHTYKRVGDLYKKRGDLIHDGLLNTISEQELTEMSQYVAEAILACLHLITDGYREKSEIIHQTDRLYDTLPSEIKTDMRFDDQR